MIKKILILIPTLAFLAFLLPAHLTHAANLDINCIVDDTSVDEGDSVRFEVEIDGGEYPYEIEWDFDDGDDSDDRIVTHRFDDEGNYEVEVTVEDDDGEIETDTCPTIHVDRDNNNNSNDDLEIECTVDDTSIDEGDYVTYRVNIDGGNSPYEIDWNGDISGDDRTERVRYNREGRYEVEVTVEDDNGEEDTDSCPDVRVGDGGNNNINVISSNNSSNNNLSTGSFVQPGQLASLNSVFLSQIPYTGPEDILMILGIIALALIWSVSVGIWLQKKRIIKNKSNRVKRFKELNKAKMGATISK